MRDLTPQEHPESPDSGPEPPELTNASDCAEELRAVLATHGIVLPSLGVDLVTFGRTLPPHRAGLVALGNCNLRTARALVAVLREAAQ